MYREDSVDSDLKEKVDHAVHGNKYRVERILKTSMTDSTSNMIVPSYRHRAYMHPGTSNISPIKKTESPVKTTSSVAQTENKSVKTATI